MLRCNLCGNKIFDYGNNPYPLMMNDDDRCCDLCNSKYVIPARIANATEEFTKDELAKIACMIRVENERR